MGETDGRTDGRSIAASHNVPYTFGAVGVITSALMACERDDNGYDVGCGDQEVVESTVGPHAVA